MHLQVIAHAHNGFSQKFGIPRQSRKDSCIETHIIFTHTYRVREALRGIEDYSHLWLLWGFHEAVRLKGDEAMRRETKGKDGWSPTVRPPRLGGNKRMGVFATRSPFRPNPIGLTSVKLLRIEDTTDNGLVLVVSGADLLDGTPIYDIKPYLPYTDCHTDATGGFTDNLEERKLNVNADQSLLSLIPEEKRQELLTVLSMDPRPSYHDDPERVYGVEFAGWNIRFQVNGKVLTVISVDAASE